VAHAGVGGREKLRCGYAVVPGAFHIRVALLGERRKVNISSRLFGAARGIRTPDPIITKSAAAILPSCPEYQDAEKTACYRSLCAYGDFVNCLELPFRCYPRATPKPNAE
jgi:hypothetical protein